MKTIRALDDFAGALCKSFIPVKGDLRMGAGSSVAVCTLGSLDLLQELSADSDLMGRIALAGRLLSENRGIDAIIKFAGDNGSLANIILCGKEVKGHLPGQALLSLARNGIDGEGMIIGALGPYPYLSSSTGEVEQFRRQVKIVDLVGVTDKRRIVASIP